MKMTTAKFAGKSLFVNENTGNVKLTSRGKAAHVSELLASLDKGNARKLRKALYSAGFRKLAGAPRKAA